MPGLTVETGRDDIIVGYKGRNYWYEIKSQDQVSKKGELYKKSKCKTATKQAGKKATWAGHYEIVWDIGQILDDIGVTNHGKA